MSGSGWWELGVVVSGGSGGRGGGGEEFLELPKCVKSEEEVGRKIMRSITIRAPDIAPRPRLAAAAEASTKWRVRFEAVTDQKCPRI
jgi:hypothetical protein